MILAKSKPTPISIVKPRAVMVVALCLLVLFIGIYAFTRIRDAAMESHCVMEVQPEGTVNGKSPVERCFATQAEAITYATGGKVNLPPDASQSDIDKALRNQSP